MGGISDLLSERSLVAILTLKLACLSVPVRVDIYGDRTVIKVVAISSRDRVMIGHPPQRQFVHFGRKSGTLAIQASVIGC